MAIAPFKARTRNAAAGFFTAAFRWREPRPDGSQSLACDGDLRGTRLTAR